MSAASVPGSRRRWSAVAGGLGWVVVPVALALASRAFSIAIVLALGAGGHARGSSPLTIWDGVWYLGIVANGYHAEGGPGGYDFAFYPGWPLLVRAASVAAAPEVGSVVLANVLFVVAAVLVWRVLDRRFGSRIATSATALLAFSPPAFVFSLAYSESLFLLAAALFFLVPSTSAWRAPVAALAMLTRIAGGAIVASAAVQAVRTRGPERRVAVLAVLGGLAAFAAWWVFIALLTGDPMGYAKGSSSWIHGSPVAALLSTARNHPVRMAGWVAFVALVGLGSLWLVRRDPELFTFSAMVLATALLPVLAGGIVHSIPRYAVVAFPAFAGLAGPLGRRGSTVLVTLFVLAQVAFAAWVVPARGTQAP